MSRPIRAGAAAVLLAVAAGCTQRESQTSAPARPARSGNIVRFDSASPQLERIRVAPVTEGVLPVDEFEIPGMVEVIPARQARLALPVPGRVRTVAVSLGDRVQRNQIVLTIETPDVSALQSAWRQAQADVRQREAAAAKAEADVSRVRDLLANRAIAQKEVLAAEMELAISTAGLEQARATRDDVARRLRLFGVDPEQQEAVATVRSPIAGEVVEVSVADGEYRSDTAAPAITVADLDRVWIAAAVPESVLARIQIGQRVSMSLTAYPGQVFEGRITRVAGTLDNDTRTAKVIAELDNTRRLLKPGMFARVRYAGPARPVVAVPAGAIVQDEGRTTVFVETKRGEFERREVSLGPRRDAAVVVSSGLAAGDRVVVDGTMLLMGL